jgi:microcystin-dependent protein
MEVMQVAFSIQLRKDTSANWSSVNPVLLKGEPGFETDTGRLKVGDGTTAWNVLLYFVPESGEPVGGVPAGSITAFAGSSAPSGYLLCDGSQLSRETYSSLFSVIGTTYGTGNGITTFNIPNLKGRMPVGLDSSQTEFNSLGLIGGAKQHTLTSNEMPSHTHTQNQHNHTATTADAGTHSHSAGTDSQGSHSHTTSIQNQINLYNSGTTRNALHASLGTPTNFGSDSQGSHSHTVYIFDSGSHSHTVTVANATAVNQNTGGGQPHNNLQPFITLNYIIKT